MLQGRVQYCSWGLSVAWKCLLHSRSLACYSYFSQLKLSYRSDIPIQWLEQYEEKLSYRNLTNLCFACAQGKTCEVKSASQLVSDLWSIQLICCLVYQAWLEERRLDFLIKLLLCVQRFKGRQPQAQFLAVEACLDSLESHLLEWHARKFYGRYLLHSVSSRLRRRLGSKLVRLTHWSRYTRCSGVGQASQHFPHTYKLQSPRWPTCADALGFQRCHQ